MKRPDVESATERIFSLGASFENRHLAKVVRERLPGPCDIAIDLGLDLMVGKRRVLAEISDRLVARPSLRVNAGIDDQAGSAPDLVSQHAEAIIRRVVHSHLYAEFLAIQSPALAEGGDIGMLAKIRLIPVLRGDGQLKSMARCGLMQCQGREVVQWTA